MSSSFQVLTPDNTNELVEALKKTTPRSKILAGGTDLIIPLHRGELQLDLIIDISGVSELRYIKDEGDRIFIGANTTFTEIAEDEFILKYAKFLAEASETVGSKQIRNRGTIGGNIGNSSPAGDTLPVLMALDSEVEIINSKKEKSKLPIQEVVKGPGKNILKHDEAITGVIFPKNSPQWRSTFAKLGTRTAVTIARISIALNAEFSELDEIIKNAKIGLGAVGKTAFRATKVEELLKGKKVSKDLADQFAKELTIAVENSIPGRSTLPYKRVAIQGVAYEAFDNLFWK